MVAFISSKHCFNVFLVGAFLGKSVRLLQWLVFFRQTTISLWLGHFSYNRSYSNYYHKAKCGQRKLVQKGPPFHILLFYRSLQNRTRLKGPPFNFFGIVRLFFENFLMSQKTPLFEFFDILQQNIC